MIVENEVQKAFEKSNAIGLSVSYFSDTSLNYLNFGKVDVSKGKAVSNETIFHACSMSKLITSLTTLILVKEKIISLTRDIDDYLTGLTVNDSILARNEKVTLESLLSHQAGFIDDENGFIPYQLGDNVPNIDSVINGGKYGGDSFQIKYPPLSTFNYSDAGYCIIEKIIESVTKMKYADVVNKFLIEPLGIKHTKVFSLEDLKQVDNSQLEVAVGHNKFLQKIKNKRVFYPYRAAAGVFTTPLDMAVVIKEILNAYHKNSKTLINNELAKKMLSPINGGKSFAGLGVFLSDEKPNTFYSLGWGKGFQCMLQVDYMKYKGVVAMTNYDPGVHQNRSIVGETVNLVSAIW